MKKLLIITAVSLVVVGCMKPKPKPKPIEIAPIGKPIELQPNIPKAKDYTMSDKIIDKNKIMKSPVRKVPKVPHM